MKISLKSARVNANLTQKELGKKLGKSQYTILNWERGYSKINVLDFKKLCEVLNVNQDDILLP